MQIKWFETEDVSTKSPAVIEMFIAYRKHHKKGTLNISVGHFSGHLLNKY